MSDTVSKLRHALSALNPTHLVIEDESAHHADHHGHQGGGHYRIHIISDQFEGLSMLQRHRLIFTIVRELMHTDIHALSISAKTPSES